MLSISFLKLSKDFRIFSLLDRNISSHILGSLEAIRVKSLRPPPDKRLADPGFISETAEIRLKAIKWGKWLVRAKNLSCSSIESSIDELPTSLHSSEHIWKALSDVSANLVKTDILFLNKSGVEFLKPLFSEPAIGWDKTKLEVSKFLSSKVFLKRNQSLNQNQFLNQS